MRLGARIVVPVLALAIVCACGEEAAPEPEGPELPPPADELEARIRERAAEVAPRMVPADTFRGELEAGARAEHLLILRRGACYRVLAQGGAGLRDLDLQLFDPSGMMLQRDATGDAAADIGAHRPVCPTGASGSYRLEVRATAGEGGYCAQVWVSR